ncbi:MAG: dipeptidase [Armatimonadetes bacterium]|nr:dipeptidase [Armatimonadota bacterium]
MLSLLLAVSLLQPTAPQDVARAHALELHKRYPLIDGHNDLPWSFRRGGGNIFDQVDIRKFREGGQTDIPRLRAGGLGGQFWSVYVPVSLGADEAVKTTKEQIGIVYKLAKRYPDTFEIAWTADDVERIFRSGKVASMVGMEGGHSINNSLKTLGDMYRLGARYMTLTHSLNTPWADSATDEPKSHGLNDFGRKVVLEMNRLGMLVDLSHVSAETMHDVLDVAKAPVIFSHSGSRAVCDHPRNVPDDVLRRLKKNGGVCMVVIFGPYTSQAIADWNKTRTAYRQGLDRQAVGVSQIEAKMADWEKSHPRPKATLKQVADHIDHIRKVAGIDSIGIGSDFDGGGGVDGLNDVSQYPDLTAELIRRGYKDEEIGKILGLNVLRVMREAERVAREMKAATTK